MQADEKGTRADSSQKLPLPIIWWDCMNLRSIYDFVMILATYYTHECWKVKITCSISPWSDAKTTTVFPCFIRKGMM